MNKRILTTELLGYGARSSDAPGAVQIRIFNDEAESFAVFISPHP